VTVGVGVGVGVGVAVTVGVGVGVGVGHKPSVTPVIPMSDHDTPSIELDVFVPLNTTVVVDGSVNVAPVAIKPLSLCTYTAAPAGV